jgi:hypothetical protein
MKRSIPGLSVALVILAGCAAGPDPAAPIEAARALVEQAEQAGAGEFAPSDLGRARQTLGRAEEAQEARRDEEATRFAERAAAEAQVALSTAAAAKAERSAQETERSIEVLRDEANRPVRGN